jgi:phosphoribosylanthranilate isomerase
MSTDSSYYRTRVKICGLKSFEEAKLAADCGADSIGLVFHAPSPRYIELENAIAIRRQLPAFVTLTALFLNETEQWVSQVVDELKPDCLQFHGTESAEFCQRWSMPYIKAIPMASVDHPAQYASDYRYAQGFLMDSNAAGRLGGSGDTFDWSKIPSNFHYPLILAGGLTPLNVADAVAQVKPWAVDVSSGVEKSRGVKDTLLIQQFCKEVHRVDCRS